LNVIGSRLFSTRFHVSPYSEYGNYKQYCFLAIRKKLSHLHSSARFFCVLYNKYTEIWGWAISVHSRCVLSHTFVFKIWLKNMTGIDRRRERLLVLLLKFMLREKSVGPQVWWLLDILNWLGLLYFFLEQLFLEKNYYNRVYHGYDK